MPIYEYRCEACSYQLEVLQRISEEPLRECPNCGQLRLVKLISAAGFRLKGGGWYETDFKSDGKKNLTARDGEKTTAASDAKGEAQKPGKSGGKDKPAATAGAKTMDTVKD